MREVEAFEAESTLSELLDRVENGEEIVITRYGRAAARLVPCDRAIDRAKVRAAMERIRMRASGLGFDLAEFKEDRDAGRP